MIPKIMRAILIASVLISPLQASATRPVLSAEKSTVQIRIKLREKVAQEGKERRTGWGGCSGVYIEENKVLTASHCFQAPENAEILQIWVKSGEKSSKATILRLDTVRDLALIWVDLKGIPIQIAKERAKGENVWAYGNPLGLPNVLTEGIISKINYIFRDEKTKHIIFDASILPGNSGGALINSKGELVGIVVRSTSMLGSWGMVGLGFAVELSEIKEFLG